MSNERPILFNGPMVRAVIEGRKTQTRRVVKPQPSNAETICDHRYIGQTSHYLDGCECDCPYGGPGGRLWARETYLRTTNKDGTPGRLIYKADGWHTVMGGPAGWRPSIHMPRWASRLTLEIVSVRVERVQDISEQDAGAEGFPGGGNETPYTFLDGSVGVKYEDECGTPCLWRSRVQWFRQLWDSINAPRGYGWNVNPWVWAIEFRRVEA